MVRETWKNINESMFDFKDYYLKIAKELPDNCRVCEVGIANGASAIFLAEAILNEGKTIDRFVLVDDLSYGGLDQQQEILKNIIKSGIYFDLLPYDSITASKKFNNDYFDIIFIDASHYYMPTILDIKSWYRKVKDESVLSGHDYFAHEEVKRAVDETIPKTITRTDIPDRIFEPEEVLRTYETAKGFGVWEIVKKHYIQL